MRGIIVFLVLLSSFAFASADNSSENITLGWIRADSSQCHEEADTQLREGYNLCTLNCGSSLSNAGDISICNTQCTDRLLSRNMDTKKYGNCKAKCFNNHAGDEIIACDLSCSNESDYEGCFDSCYSAIEEVGELESCVDNCYWNIKGQIQSSYDYAHLFCDSMLTIGEITETAYEGGLLFPLRPIDDFRISSGWYRTGGHYGIDYVPIDNTTECEVYSSAPGTVTRIERYGFISSDIGWCIPRYPTEAYGHRVQVSYVGEDGTYYEVLYGHLKEGSITVSEGEHVEAGDVLGIMGNTGCTEAPHLHYEIRNIAAGGGTSGSVAGRPDPYDIYGSSWEYPDVTNDYSKECGENYMWATCPPTN